jgi:3-oxoacyl-[acyl-carrier-protein] synthase III
MNLPYANRGIRITGVGASLPDKVLTNEDLTHHMQTTDSWIRERTGIGQRHIGGTTAGLATEAARQAMERAGVHGDDIDLVILATTSPDHTCPGTSPAVAAALGLDCGAFDLQAACSGWVYGLIAARGFVAQGMNRILVIGSETLDRITDYTDRGTGILFGNGAGAAVVEALPDADDLLGWDVGADGRYVSILYAEPGDVLKMDGKEVFRQAVAAMQRSTTNTLAMAGLTVADIDVVIPHQANVRIVEAAWKRIGFTMEQTVMILENTGNTSAASIPLALDHALTTDRIHPGQLVLFLGFGAGMTWASALVRWPG